MNERFKELAEQATETFTTYFDGRGNVTETYFNKEKFAELIVQECANVCHDADYQGPAFSEVILNHFGVKE